MVDDVVEEVSVSSITTEHLRLNRKLRIGDEHHEAAVGIHLRDLADQAGTVGDGHSNRDTVAAADSDLDRVLEVAGRLTDHLRSHCP